MARQARLDIPGALHHIMVRGIIKANIFDDDEDKARFLERLGQNVLEEKCWARWFLRCITEMGVELKEDQSDVILREVYRVKELNETTHP
jgi:hypothetical protein